MLFNEIQNSIALNWFALNKSFMNPFILGKTIAQSYFLMRKRSLTFGEPVNWTNEEAHQFLNALPQNPLMQTRFAIAANNKNSEVIYHHNLEKFVAFKKQFTINAYFRLIHLDYVGDYIKWGEMVYQYADSMREVLAPMKQNFRITIPLKLIDGHFHWVLMEAYPLQMDRDNNMISHLNIYTVLSRFDAKVYVPLVGDIWYNNTQQQDWTHDLWKKVATHRAFILTPTQSQIVAVLNQNMDFSNAEIALALNKTKNNVDIQNKLILARARETFGSQYFTTIKDVVKFLQEMQFFQEQIYKADD